MPSNTETPAPSLLVSDVPTSGSAVLSASSSLPESVWSRIVEICGPDARRATEAERTFSVPWTSALAIIPKIAKLRGLLGFSVLLDEASTRRFEQFQSERKAVAAAKQAQDVRHLTDSEVDAALVAVGFNRRELKPFQKRDVARLIALPHGANFSVPGAGKTTAALAVHALTRKPDTCLLIVAPKNAFGAWDETLAESIDIAAPHGLGSPFIRLTGDETQLTDSLYSGRLKFLVTYERFARYQELFTVFMARRPVHLVLDESHRIKAGVNSQRGQAILAIAALPVRRDILSGTPIPHDLSDLESQWEFLWPGQNAANLANTSPGVALRNLYVRTTKGQLGLTPPKREFVRVSMAPFHSALYGVLRDETLQQIAKIRHSRVDIASARRSVIRLLQASTNPLSTAFKIVGADDSLPVANLIDGLVAEGDSAKIRRACELVRETVQQGRKIVVWTIFTETILRLTELLSELHPLPLYGATPTGELDDDETREGRIRLFHDSDQHNLLIANPAACSEGISLHKKCHEALYVDRSYNAAHYLQSVDRIHRIGLDPGVETRIRVLQTTAPQGIGSIDFSVSRRLLKKMETMNSILDDEDIRAMALDEEQAMDPVDDTLSMEDLADLLEQLSSGTTPREDEQI